MLREEWHSIGANKAYLFIREWKPEAARVKAAVCLVHGMGEHGDRYSHVAEYFTEAGYALMALDQYGHGRSSGKRGHLNSLIAAASDTGLIIEEAGKRHPDVPVFLYGHSMGGNVALNCALRLNPPIKGLILTSPWLRLAFKPHPAVEWIGRRLASIVPALQQETGLNPADLYRPGYAKAAPIVEDPLCHTKITLHTYREIDAGGEWALAHADSLEVPVLLMHGSSDRITSLAASELLAERLGAKCEWKIREGGFHELHNDVEGEQNIKQIIDWIELQLSK
ncbi:lysophospholipase [Paenibacillus alkaliterrae]|uniref:alpha/beta hydrolase n=1 Tax=Paenibacillus alkaliterrae TaxID=320909 RepID=UPI001F259511|nr:alpha/beta hydrolase [Paenibacillus alkaliterrae]MCF2937725.1 lysophospholipase [Paenibacillus alkaliterrae]